MYVLYYDNYVDMNGAGIKYIYDADYDEKMKYDTGMEKILEEFANECPDYYNEDYNIHLFVNAGYGHYYIDVDYKSGTPDDLINKMSEWLCKNTIIEKILEVTK
jgi:hypothetical protein